MAEIWKHVGIEDPVISRSTEDIVENLDIIVQFPYDVVFYYTTDGTTPTTRSRRYTKPITIDILNNTEVTVKILAVDIRGFGTEIFEETFYGLPPTIRILEVGIDGTTIPLRVLEDSVDSNIKYRIIESGT